jgi:hypothetical protein
LPRIDVSARAGRSRGCPCSRSTRPAAVCALVDQREQQVLDRDVLVLEARASLSAASNTLGQPLGHEHLSARRPGP